MDDSQNVLKLKCTDANFNKAKKSLPQFNERQGFLFFSKLLYLYCTPN